MKLLIIGTGYVGLVTGTCFAEMGHQVVCLDIDQAKIEKLQKGMIPFYEPGLEELVRRNMDADRLHFSTSYEDSAPKAEICVIAVPTPSNSDGSCDISYVLSAASKLARHLTLPATIIIKSTVPVGTQKRVKEVLREILNADVEVVSNPEFLKEGSAVADCMKPDRIILGVDCDEALATMRKLYSPFTVQHDRILSMDPASAELTKYAANAMLATRISFMNELAGLCEKIGADIHSVRIGIGSDQRIGYAFLYAGAGYGGSCFPKDIAALRAMAKEQKQPTLLIDAVDAVNQRQKTLLGQKIEKYFRGDLKGKTIAIWGLSFKPDTDDLREAPSLVLIEHLLAKGANLRLYDPIAMDGAKILLPSSSQIYWAHDEYDAASGSDAVALITEWKQFRFVNFDQIKQKMQGCAIFDGRNQYRSSEMCAKGFTYFGIGNRHSAHSNL